ncbi:type II secretion system protein [Periweissella cryptocerci]|uniref:Type II secretion system protein n=1 Tax=Periweissella cryptocerci TaxID=2506420 RepID=A0A4P6YRY6_9LACO|nr:type II secretion system protein [Periweissella cryptocerci]QBO35363.1 type II secretion system protein [Periweissella cryptocerci]
MKKMLSKKAESAFTLLESLIVLGVVATCLIIGYLKVNYDNEQSELRFWQELDVTWRQAQTSVRDTKIVFDFRFTNNYVDIYRETKKVKRLNYPNTLKFSGVMVHVPVSAEGHINPTTVSLFRANGSYYSIKWGFGWGVYRIEPEPKGLYRG